MSKAKSPQERRDYQFEQCYLKLAVKHGRAPTYLELSAAGFPKTTVLENFGRREEIYNRMRKKYPARMLDLPLDKAHDSSPKRDAMAKEYARKYKELRRVPTCVETGLPDKSVHRLFGGMEGLHNHSREKFPGYFFDTPVESVKTRKKFTELASELRKKNRYFVTCVGQGDVVDPEALKSIHRFAEDLDAAPIGIVAYDPAARNFGTTVDKKAVDGLHIVHEDTALNDNFFLSTIGVTMKQLIPLTGLHGIAQRNRSMVLASPKQQLEYVPTANTALPHALMTTGAITLPNYLSDKPESQRTAYIATHTHVMGGLIVEIENEQKFHFRQVQFDSKGRFADLGRLYDKDGSKAYPPAALRPGDYHNMCTDLEIKQTIFGEMVKLMQPKTLFLEDFFDGMSVNHHERKSVIQRAIRAQAGQLNLQSEVAALGEELHDLQQYIKNIYIVKSNHDMFLEKYLANGWHIQDPENTAFGSKLLIAATEGKDPLQYGVELLNGGPISDVRWLGLNDDLRIGGVFMPAHGHLGPGGSRNPSLRSLARMYGECSAGHSHVPGIYQGAWRTGTMSARQEYEKGPSARMHSPLFIYDNGGRQLLNIIDGSWRVP